MAGQHLQRASLSLARLTSPRRLCQQKTVVEQRLVRDHTEKVMWARLRNSRTRSPSRCEVWGRICASPTSKLAARKTGERKVVAVVMGAGGQPGSIRERNENIAVQ